MYVGHALRWTFQVVCGLERRVQHHRVVSARSAEPACLAVHWTQRSLPAELLNPFNFGHSHWNGAPAQANPGHHSDPTQVASCAFPGCVGVGVSVLWVGLQQERAGEGLEVWRAFGVNMPCQSWLGGMENARSTLLPAAYPKPSGRSEQKINHNGHGRAGFWCLWARPSCRAHIEISEKVTDGNTWSISLSEGLGHHTAQRASASQHLLLLPQTTHSRVKTHSSCKRTHICSYRRLRAKSRSTNPAKSINTRSYRRPTAQWGTTTPAGDPKLSQEAPATRAGLALQPASHQLRILKVNLLPHPNFTSFPLLFLLFLLIFSFTVFFLSHILCVYVSSWK